MGPYQLQVELWGPYKKAKKTRGSHLFSGTTLFEYIFRGLELLVLGSAITNDHG